MTSAQQKYIELREKGVKAALFEGAWGNYVFEIGERVTDGSLCGFVTYEGEEQFFGIVHTHKFDAEMCPPLSLAVGSCPLESVVSSNQYAEKINQILELIRAGETYQVNYSIPFVVPAGDRDPFAIYCALASMNPSPYMCFIETDQGALISNSPESLMELSPDGQLITKPIKGTMARGATPEQDATIEATLMASEKNKAELAMIVDLERNDLGRVCVPGSVRATPRHIEKYSHVIHTVAKVEGRLAPDKNWHDAFKALFPGGSVTGCPKIRTMEIIKKLEDGPRGIYCGSAGYMFSPVGAESTHNPVASFNILIRSLWFDREMKTITFRSGGGIVADSIPQDEYAELLHKAAAIASTLSL